MVIEQAMGLPKWCGATAAQVLGRFVEEMKIGAHLAHIAPRRRGFSPQCKQPD